MRDLKNILLIALLSLVFGVFAQAESFEFTSANYKEAKKAESFIRFDMSSTKLGLITTSFDGVVKSFTVMGEVKGDEIKSGAAIEFAAQSLDTDVDGRNEKMWETCLDYKNHPRIKISLNQGFKIADIPVDIPATISLRGYEKPIAVNVKGARSGKDLIIDLTSLLSIKNLEIPDPSIAIASVKDQIKITGHIVIHQK